MLVAIDPMLRAELVHMLQEVLGGHGRIRTEEVPMETQAWHIDRVANLHKVNAILIFFITAVASIIGSLQAGLVNTAVLAHTVKRGPGSGRRMALGGAIPEFIYAVLAFHFATWLLTFLGLDARGITLLVGGVLILLGMYFLFLFKPVFDLDRVDVHLLVRCSPDADPYGIHGPWLVGRHSLRPRRIRGGLVPAAHACAVGAQGAGTLAAPVDHASVPGDRCLAGSEWPYGHLARMMPVPALTPADR